MLKKVLTLLVLIPTLSFSQTVIKPGQSTVVTAEPCPPSQTIVIHDTVWKCPPTTPPPTTPPPSTQGYKLTYSNDYDQTSDINVNQLGRGKQTTFDGRGVFMSEVRNGDASISNGYRSEQQYDNQNGTPTEGAWEWEAYYEDWNNVRGNGHSFQFHPKSSSGSAVWSLQNYGGRFDVVRSLNGSNFHQSGSLKAVEQNRWYKFRLEAKWSSNSDGYLRFYIDGILYHEYKGATCGTGGVYVKVGQNCWTPIPTRAVVYYDNFTVFSKM